MALSWSQGSLLGVKDFSEVQNHANAADQFAGGSALVQGCPHCIHLHSVDISGGASLPFILSPLHL